MRDRSRVGLAALLGAVAAPGATLVRQRASARRPASPRRFRLLYRPRVPAVSPCAGMCAWLRPEFTGGMFSGLA